MNVPTVPGYYLLEVEALPERVPQIRRIVAAHLRYWGLDPQVEPVCRGVDELLRNVVEHAEDKTCVVELWWHGKHLIAAVADHERRMPRLLGPAQGGLALVAALSDGWGIHGRPDGKIVWFSRRVKSTERAPLVARVPLTDLREAKRLPAPVGAPVAAGHVERDTADRMAPAAHVVRDATIPKVMSPSTTQPNHSQPLLPRATV